MSDDLRNFVTLKLMNGIGTFQEPSFGKYRQLGIVSLELESKSVC